jgi:hypothetical protein
MKSLLIIWALAVPCAIGEYALLNYIIYLSMGGR